MYMNDNTKNDSLEENPSDKNFYLKLVIMIIILVVAFLILALPSYYIPNTVPWTV